MAKSRSFRSRKNALVFPLLVVFCLSMVTSYAPKASAAIWQGMPTLQRDTSNPGFWMKPSLSDLASIRPASQLVVKFNTSNDAVQEAIADKYNAETDLEINSRTIVLDVASTKNIEQLADKVEAEPSVVYAEPDAKLVAMGEVTSYGFDQMHVAAAHNTYSVDGTGVLIAVLDTGVDYLHEDLAANIWSNSLETAGNDVDDDGNGYVDDTTGWDFAGTMVGVSPEDNDPNDEYGHGTHVSGIAAAADNTVGTIGVAPSAEIMPVKVLDDSGYGTNSSIAAGIRYAVDNGADVINMSLGSGVPSNSIREAVNYAESNGVLVVAAAGNSYGFNTSSSYPAAYPNVISVSATNQDGLKTAWSNWGKVEVAAPGDEILSSVPSDRYAKYSGTSMASPFVAGLMALAVEQHPAFTNDQFRHALATNSTDVFDTGNDLRSGAGFASAENLTDGYVADMSISSSTWRIVADDNNFTEGSATITAVIRDAAGDPVSGETINFTTNKGDLSAASGVTDLNGEVSVTLTADDVEGSAAVAATHGTYGTATSNVLLFNDKVYAHEVSLMKSLADSSTEMKFMAGETMSAELTLRALQLNYSDTMGSRTADVDWQIEDSSAAIVPGLTGSKVDVTVGAGGSPYGNATLEIALPDDLANDTYTFIATVTDQESAKTDTISRNFTVGGSAEILIAPMTSGNVIDTHDTDYGVYGPSSIAPITEALDAMGQEYDVLPYDTIYSGYDIADYQTVIFTNMQAYSDPIVGEYLSLGGNALVMGNTDFATHLFGTYDEYFSTGWCGANNTYTSTDLSFSCAGEKFSPDVVSGSGGGIFDVDNYSISAFDLNSDGSLDQMISDEFVAGSDATVELEYDSGINSPATAGISRDDGTSRLIALGFSMSAIDNNGPGGDREQFLTDTLDFLRPTTGLNVTGITPRINTKTGSGIITVTGTNFEVIGRTTVSFEGHNARSVSVLDRNTMRVRLPSGLALGTYNMTVTSPFGATDTVTNAVTIKHAAPRITEITPTSGNNNQDRLVSVFVDDYRAGATVKLGTGHDVTYQLSNVFYPGGIRKLNVRVPAGFPEGRYRITVINTDGQRDTSGQTYWVK